jgi:large subunit ribosomal protein L18Ae
MKKAWLKQYYIIGREWPMEYKKEPELFFMKIYAPNNIIAKSRFWYFLKKTRKVKKSMGELVSFKLIRPIKTSFVRNFGIWIKYDSKNGPINMYKEYRDISTIGAVEQMYLEMAGSYKVKWSSIIVLRTEELNDNECIRSKIKQFHGVKTSFPFFTVNFRNSGEFKGTNFKANRLNNMLGI